MKGILRLVKLIAERPATIDLERRDGRPFEHVVMVGEFHGPATGRNTLDSDQLPKLSTRENAGSVSPTGTKPPAQALRTPRVHGSIVLEGGGGRGLAFPAVLEALERFVTGNSSASGRVEIDEFVGTSAGAITAGLLAAGYSPKELREVSDKLSFEEFYSDYVALDGGVDQRLRGIDRNGLFSTRRMYETFQELLSKKLGISGRPVFFADLPKSLKIPAMVVARDVPPSLRHHLEIAPDGLIEFSNEKTPYMDVAAAMAASASVPVFFQAPVVHVSAPAARRDPAGRPYLFPRRSFHLQLVDGGALLNFPTALARRSAAGKTALLTLPVYTEAAGKKLSTLDFGGSSAEVDEVNGAHFAKVGPSLPKLVEAARQQGFDRIVFGLNLTRPSEQASVAVQGESRAASETLRGLAKKAGLDVLAERPARKLADANGNAPTPLRDVLGELIFDALLEGPDRPWRVRGEDDSAQYVPRRRALTGIDEVLGATLAGLLASKELHASRTFERDAD
ncbi:MAG: patatin-like phospholipase family protein [Deltaproteobacteria bacterium]|nr:patatin-like phospholipase family protein [Deltaproteobacteria bacterium]